MQSNMEKGLSQTLYTDTRLFLLSLSKNNYVTYRARAGPKGGTKGAHAPTPLPPPPAGSDHKAYLAPGKKKKLMIDLITPKASCEKMVPVRVVHSDLILARLQSVQMVGH